jgi:AraC-like DNA-binding protein/mannose-6-phosphate isomerase-like protein (cupin superfamily)
MEDFLIQKLSAVTDEEKRILSGSGLDRGLYTEDADFIVHTDRLMRGRDIDVRTHTRYTDFPLHRHNYLEVMIVLSGSITHEINGERITLGEGDILILNKHTSHSIKRADTSDIGVNVIISDSFVESLLKELSETVFSELAEENSRPDGKGVYLCFSAKGNRQISNIVENLLFELIEYSADMQILRSTTSLLFNYLSRKSGKLLRIASTLPDRDGVRRAAILGYLRSSYRRATLTELAETMFLSVPYLSKIVVSLFGKSFKELLLDERMKRAGEMIKNTDMPIGDIINSVGYENESYFHREFKKKNGVTPLVYRRLEREKSRAIDIYN